MNRLSTIAISGAVAAALTGTAHAEIENGSFESGDFSGWTLTGMGAVVDGSFGSGPTDGQFQAVITTGGTTSRAALETFLGLPPGSLNTINGTATAGTAVKATFTASAGATVSFDWNFVCNDAPPFNDFSFIVIDGAVAKLADTAVCNNPSATPFVRETGFAPFSHTFASGGTHTIGFGVIDLLDTVVDSGLIVDNVAVTREPICGWRTQVQEEYGDTSDPAGAYMFSKFNSTFPFPGLDLGCGTSRVSFQNRHPVDLHLPVSGDPRPLTTEEKKRRYLDGWATTDANGNTIPLYDPQFGTRLWGETAALGISIGFDRRADFKLAAQPHSLADLVVAEESSPCVDLTVGEVFTEAQNVLFGCPSAFSPEEISTCVQLINEAFRDGGDGSVCTLDLTTP